MPHEPIFAIAKSSLAFPYQIIAIIAGSIAVLSALARAPDMIEAWALRRVDDRVRTKQVTELAAVVDDVLARVGSIQIGKQDIADLEQMVESFRTDLTMIGRRTDEIELAVNRIDAKTEALIPNGGKSAVDLLQRVADYLGVE